MNREQSKPWVIGHDGIEPAKVLSNELLSQERRHEIAGLKDKIVALERERDGEVWYWLGDGHDHPESLCCPILIEPEDMMTILAKIQKQDDCPECGGDARGIPTLAEPDGAEAGCSHCNGTGKVLKHRLDRPDREKIAEIIFDSDGRNYSVDRSYDSYDEADEELKNYYRWRADQILALFDVEEIRKQEKVRLFEEIEEKHLIRPEREDIWQALKGKTDKQLTEEERKQEAEGKWLEI